MDVFTQRRFTVSVIVLLAVLNIGTLALLWLRAIPRPAPPAPAGPPSQQRPPSSSVLKRELGLSDEQFEKYLEVREQNRNTADGIREEIHVLKRQMINELFKPEPDTLKVERTIQAIAEKQGALERATFDYLRSLKELCGEGQQDKLRRLLDEFFRSTNPPPQGSGDRPPPSRQPPP